MKVLWFGVVLASTASAEVTRETAVVEIKTTVGKTKVASSLTVDEVRGKLQTTYFDHVQRCYRERFGAKPPRRAKGTLELVFGVEPDGTTSGVVAASFDKRLGTCIARRARTWTFAPPTDTDAKPIATSFVFELALTPISPKRTGPDHGGMTEEDAARFADLLVSQSTSQGEMTTRRAGADLGAQVGGAGGHGATGSGGDPTRATASRPSAPSGRISVTSKSALDSTSLTPEVVLRKIQSAYMAGLKRCYKTQLGANPTLQGTLKLAFTVEATGRTSGAIVTSFDANLDRCVKGMMASWRFPAPMDGDRAVTAGFELGLRMVPD